MVRRDGKQQNNKAFTRDTILSVCGLVCGTFAISAVVLRYGCGGRELRCSLHLRFACDCSSSCIPHVFGFGGHGIRPCHGRRCALLHAPGWPTQRRGLYRHQYYWLPISGRRASFWIARVDRCRTDSAHAMPPTWLGWAHLAEKIQSVPRQRLFRDATESIVKTTKHLHTGHQAASVNMHLSCATSFARAPPPLSKIYTVSLHHDDMVPVKISSIDCTVGL